MKNTISDCVGQSSCSCSSSVVAVEEMSVQKKVVRADEVSLDQVDDGARSDVSPHLESRPTLRPASPCTAVRGELGGHSTF